MAQKNGTWKAIAKILAVCVIALVGWFGNEVWSKQQKHDISIKTLQASIITVEKTVLRMEDSLANDRGRDRVRDSIQMDMAIKVDIMFDSR